MKKRFAGKALAFVLVLVFAFSVFASAIEGEPVAQAAIDITVGEIVYVRQLVEDMGYTWPGNPRQGVRISHSGAVNVVNEDYWTIYGEKSGQGSVTITVTGKEPFVVGFNVTAAANPLVREMSVTSSERFTITQLLENMGYVSDDIERSTHWINKTSQNMDILYGGNIATRRPATARGKPRFC